MIERFSTVVKKEFKPLWALIILENKKEFYVHVKGSNDKGLYCYYAHVIVEDDSLILHHSNDGILHRINHVNRYMSVPQRKTVYMLQTRQAFRSTIDAIFYDIDDLIVHNMLRRVGEEL